MNLSRLKLVSGHGDQTLSAVRFVVPGAGSGDTAMGTADLLQSGLRFAEGRPAVSTNLWQSINGAARAEELFVVGVPSQFHLGYGVFTTAYVDRVLHRVVGAPMEYAEGRQQLALYMDREVEPARERIEAEVAEGYAMDQRPTFVVEPVNVVGFFRVAPGFRSGLARLKVLADSLQPVDMGLMTDTLGEYFRPAEPAAEVLKSSVAGDLIVGTLESLVISRLRMMRWQGLGALGYTFYDGEVAIETPKSEGGLDGHREQVAQLQKAVESSTFFTGRLAWLHAYVLTAAQIMHVELDEGGQMQ